MVDPETDTISGWRPQDCKPSPRIRNRKDLNNKEPVFNDETPEKRSRSRMLRLERKN